MLKILKKDLLIFTFFECFNEKDKIKFYNVLFLLY